MSHRFTREDLERTARLARLELNAAEQDLFAQQVAGILDYADQIQRIDTSGVEPTSHPAGGGGAMRDDAAVPSLARAESLAASADADTAAGLFKVPRVLG